MYIEVILPVPLADTYTYFVPPEMEALIVSGGLVNVEFGKKHYIALVHSIHNNASKEIKTIRPITSVEISHSIIRNKQLDFWQWIANYYLCKLGDVYKAVIPSGFRSGKLPKRKNKKEKTTSTIALNKLSPLQEKALKEIQSGFQSKEVCLLHGVTSSGKTEIYTHLIQETIDKGQQVLYILPEIALTTQITSRLDAFFGDKLLVYHSKISNIQRIHIWNKLLSQEASPIVLGVRSSVFLPFQNLGLIIVDEEHEPSYKQQEPAPRYHARNAAIVLAQQYKAKTLLGSATPSIESFYNTQSGKYAYVYLDKRFEDTELPIITPVNTKELRRKKIMKSLFSPLLIEKIQDTVEKGEQVLLFQNRRGFAPGISCKICEWTPRCRFCDISLSLHKQKNSLTCHYCGREYALPKECPECGNTNIKPIGFGTEKVEEEVIKLFPDISVERMDSDSANSKRTTEDIIKRFENGETQVLIGTQMISKGLDFEKVSLVGILSADSLMNFPDFRAYERAYQLMSQVAGRAGRRKKQGEVILQTSHPEHPLIDLVIKQDYEGMYQMQIDERSLFRYPPLFRLIHITLKHRKDDILNDAAILFANKLRSKLGDRILGPDKPAISKTNNLYIKRIMVKIEPSASLASIRKIFAETQTEIFHTPEYRYIVVQYDVDPV